MIPILAILEFNVRSKWVNLSVDLVLLITQEMDYLVPKLIFVYLILVILEWIAAVIQLDLNVAHVLLGITEMV